MTSFGGSHREGLAELRQLALGVGITGAAAGTVFEDTFWWKGPDIRVRRHALSGQSGPAV